MATTSPTVETVLAEAVEIGDEARRRAYLEAACAGDPALRAEVDRLLACHFAAGGFLEAPVCQLVDSTPAPTDDQTQDQAQGAVEDVGASIGHYRLLERIGQGGMGEVYVAEQTWPVRRRVALKIVRAGMDSRQVVARFEAERQALAMMDHPHIARIFDGGTTPSGRPYFVMELVRGLPITEFCDQAGLGLLQRIELFQPVCDAVRHAHNKAVVHRDLKPSNVLVTVLDGLAVPKVIDFGIAKAISQRLSDQTVYTGFFQVLGTPAYMSPEQVELSGVDVDTRADVYSLGVLLYELLTGTTPLDLAELTRAGFDGMRRMIRETEPRRPSQQVSTLDDQSSATLSQRRGVDRWRFERSLSGELDWIVMKAIEKDRRRRYQSPADLSDDLKRYLDGEPVRACPPSWTYRLAKLARRHRVALATSALVVAALVSGTAVSVWQAVRATEARRVANAEQRRAEESFEQAMEAVERLLSRVGDVRLRDVPQMEQVRADVLRDAVQLFERILSQSPADPRARVRTARARIQYAAALDLLGSDSARRDAELSQAETSLDRLRRELPKDPAVFKLLAEAHLRRAWIAAGPEAEDEPHLRAAIEGLRPLARGPARDAEAAIHLANALRTLSDRLFQKGRVAEAEALLDESLEVCGPAPAATDDVRASGHYLQAMRAFRVADFATATAEVDRAIAARTLALASQAGSSLLRHELVMDRALKGQILLRMGRTQEAVAPLEEAATLIDALIRDFPRVPAYQRTMPYVRHYLVEALARLGRREEAVRQIRIAEPLYGTVVDLWTWLESDWALVGEHECVVEITCKRLRDDPNDHGRQKSLARALLELDRTDEARPFIQRLVERHPDDPDTWKLAADLASEDSRWDDAERAATRAIALDPIESYIYKRRARSRQMQGRSKEALADLRKALELDATDLTALFWFDRPMAESDPAMRAGLLELADWLVVHTRNEERSVLARARLRAQLRADDRNEPPAP